ncbi:MAG: response regulator transcription factor [Bacteroidetes bacterium]|nr:response regulator transcription factor [Bacteroidota bacterium]
MIRISLADDHKLIREGIRAMLESGGEFKIISESSNGRELIDCLELAENHPDMVVADISMPVMDGIQAVREISQKWPQIPCVALSLHDDFKNIFQMIDAGAKAYLLKDCSKDLMVATLKEVMEKGACYSSFVVEKLLEHQKNTKETAVKKMYDNLSDREKEYIRLSCTEYSNKEIADKMNVSPRTVDGYRDSVFLKSGAESRVGVVLFAIEIGLYVPGNWKIPGM